MAHEHKDLVGALAIGDAASARRIAVEQINAAQQMVSKAFLRSPTLLEAPVTVPQLRAVLA